MTPIIAPLLNQNQTFGEQPKIQNQTNKIIVYQVKKCYVLHKDYEGYFTI